MPDYPRFEFSRREVRRAGQMIAAKLPWTPQNAPELLRAFTVANSWRDSHALPMGSIRRSIIYYMGRASLSGITAARLKRMPAISAKISRVGLDLNQLQDLGGVRAILPDIGSVRLLLEVLYTSIRHPLRHQNDYINAPKKDGYRSHHLIFNFEPRRVEHEVFRERRIELQVRTRL